MLPALCLAQNSPSMPSVPAPTLAPAPRLLEAFRIGETTFASSAAIIKLAEEIKAQKHFNPAGLRPDADAARHAERLSALAACDALASAHAPQASLAQYNHAASILSQPLQISPNAIAQNGNAPDAQYVESVFDEADSLFPDDDGLLAAWIKISRGSAGLWAFHLGRLAASIESAPPNPQDAALLDTASDLAQSAPPGTPQTIIAALKEVAGEYSAGHLKPTEWLALDQAIHDTFGV